MANLLIARGVVGSRAYGLENEFSDTDTMEVFMAPTTSLLSLRGITEGSGVGKNEFDGDRTSHEIGKFASLCAKGNPSVLEFLFLDSYLYDHFYFARLRLLRQQFLSQRMHKTYAGYAFGQLQRIKNRSEGLPANTGSFSADTRKRTEKHARHIVRLLHQLKEAKYTGTLRVRLTLAEADHCRSLGKLAVDNQDAFIHTFDNFIEKIDAMPSKLPVEPDEDSINQRLIELRISELETAGVIPLLSRHADTRTRATDPDVEKKAREAHGDKILWHEAGRASPR